MTEDKKTYYKVLKDGQNFNHTGTVINYSLPVKLADGSFTPGEWHELKGAVKIPSNALHLTSKPKDWYAAGCKVYEAEYEGESVDHDNESQLWKIGCKKIRLIKELTNEELLPLGLRVVSEGAHNVGDGEKIYAYGNSTVRADGNSTVRADGNSTVEADGNSTVRADGNSTVRAYGNSTVEADGNSTVRADGNSTVRADGNSTVRADGNSTVEAAGNSTVNIYQTWWTKTPKVNVSANAVLIDRTGDKPVITLAKVDA